MMLLHSQESIKSQWTTLDNQRSTMLRRLETLSGLTVASVMVDEFHDGDDEELTNSASSLGAQAATHLTNKLMLALFAPSNPFVRLDMPAHKRAELLEQLGITEDILTTALSNGERDAMREMERIGIRPALHEGLLHLVVVGNILMDLSGDVPVFHPIKDYVVRRNKRGEVVLLIIQESYQLDDLDEEVQQVYRSQRNAGARPEDKVCLYTRVKRVGKSYRVTQSVEDVNLPGKFSSKYSLNDVPYHALTWRLPAKRHYGVGRVEDYYRDLASHDLQSEALTDGAVLASQFRWLVNPSGMTRVEDFLGQENGAAVPGNEQDVALAYANIGQQLSTVLAISQQFERRIGHGFMVGSAVTRDAERVTVEEIRMQAQELESSLGGVYSRLALDIQLPLANWLLTRAKVEVKGTDIEPMILTGLDALSRSADLQRLVGFLQDVAALSTLPPETRDMLREPNILADMAAGRGVDRSRVLASQEEVAERQQQRQAQMMAEQGVQPPDNEVLPEPAQ